MVSDKDWHASLKRLDLVQNLLKLAMGHFETKLTVNGAFERFFFLDFVYRCHL